MTKILSFLFVFLYVSYKSLYGDTIYIIEYFNSEYTYLISASFWALASVFVIYSFEQIIKFAVYLIKQKKRQSNV